MIACVDLFRVIAALGLALSPIAVISLFCWASEQSWWRSEP